MIGWIIAILGFLFVFGLVVFIHEFGHFIVAKMSDVEVEAFALGMGPAFLKFKWGETEYRLCSLPLGGYVKLAGEEADEIKEEQDNPRAFYNQNVWTRTLILVAGAVGNLFLGYMIYVGFGMTIGEVIQPPKVGYVQDTMVRVVDSGDTERVDAPADGKLQIGDRIHEMNGYEVNTFQEIMMRNELLGSEKRRLTVERDGETMVVEIQPVRTIRAQLKQPSYIMGILPYYKPEVDRVREQGLAAEWGFEEGDKIEQFGDTTVLSWFQFQHYLGTHKGDWPVVVQRNGSEQRLMVDLSEEALEKPLGMNPPTEVKKYGFGESFVYGFTKTEEAVYLMIEALGRLVSGRLSIKTMAGPIGIVKMTSDFAASGIVPLLYFTAFFSINLGVINLLPLPPLDGGHILLSIPEMFTGSPLPERLIGLANQVGIILLIGFFVFISYMDLTRFDFFEGLLHLIGAG